MTVSDETEGESRIELSDVGFVRGGSSVRTKPGTDPDEAFDIDSDDSSVESDDSVVIRFLQWILG